MLQTGNLRMATLVFGGVSLANCKAPDAAYFNILGSFMAVYPLSWDLPLSAGVLALFAALLLIGFTRRRLTAAGLLVSLMIFPAATMPASGRCSSCRWDCWPCSARGMRNALQTSFWRWPRLACCP